MEHWTEYTRFFTALLVILDPFMAVPIFLALTHHYTPAERRRVANIATLSVALILVVSALSGERLLLFMGTSLASFWVGGGIVLMLMALSMLRAQPDTLRTTENEAKAAEGAQSVAVVPLAIPLLAGPGAISTVIIQMHRTTELLDPLLVMMCIILVCAVLWIVLRLAAPIGNTLGESGLNIINRLFGLILAAIAIEVMANGLRQLFPALGG